MLHPTSKPRRAYVTECLEGRRGPVVASTDYIRAFPDQIRQWVPGGYRTLGTDGYGRSDSRSALRRFFEVDRHYVAVAALKELADSGEILPSGWPRRFPSTSSIPTRRCRRAYECHRVHGRSSRHRRLRRRTGNRDPGLGRRHRGRRGSPGHAGVRQGDHGRAGAVRPAWSRRSPCRSATGSRRAPR